jgi:molybdenum cofactor cytidylyltransferase
MRFKLAAVVLAAGASRRYQGGNKLLADLGNGPLIRIVAQNVLKSGIEDVIVVTGNDSQSVEAALEGLPLRFAHNEDWRTGIGGSIALGISSVAASTDGAFIVLGDTPFMEGELLDSLGEAFDQANGKNVVFPVLSDGAQRNPVLWPREFFNQLVRLSGDNGAKSLLARYASHCKAVSGFPEATFNNINTRDDLRATHQFTR